MLLREEVHAKGYTPASIVSSDILFHWKNTILGHKSLSFEYPLEFHYISKPYDF